MPWEKNDTESSETDRGIVQPVDIRSDDSSNGDEDESGNNPPSFSHNGYGLPPLSEISAWPQWLEMLEKSMINESQTTHLALYIYCKKQALLQNNQQE